MATNQNLILWPTLSQKPKSPVIPRSKVDPTMSRKSVSKMERDIEDRYYAIKVALKALFDQRLTGREREVNSHNWHFLCHVNGAEPTLYQVNAGKFIYDMSAQELAELLEAVQGILDDYLLDGGEQNLWAMDYVVAEAQRGTLEAFNNLSQQSQVYASQTTLQQLLSSPGYLNQIASARLTTFSDWKVISDTARGDLTNIITDAVARGVNPRETASVISKRLDVSMSKAKNIAQTEQVGALREAQWNETDWASERLGLNTGLLHLSALKPTTRTTHAFWHGKVRTVQEVRDWYAVDGNKYHCYCSQIPVLLNDDGSIFSEGLADKLARERKAWGKNNNMLG
ncbi:phage head morphogenesis protein [Klebsiella variicola]|nr:phage head morphogenesis protein [Klebsiella variicola]